MRKLYLISSLLMVGSCNGIPVKLPSSAQPIHTVEQGVAGCPLLADAEQGIVRAAISGYVVDAASPFEKIDPDEKWIREIERANWRPTSSSISSIDLELNTDYGVEDDIYGRLARSNPAYFSNATGDQQATSSYIARVANPDTIYQTNKVISGVEDNFRLLTCEGSETAQYNCPSAVAKRQWIEAIRDTELSRLQLLGAHHQFKMTRKQIGKNQKIPEKNCYSVGQGSYEQKLCFLMNQWENVMMDKMKESMSAMIVLDQERSTRSKAAVSVRANGSRGKPEKITETDIEVSIAYPFASSEKIELQQWIAETRNALKGSLKTGEALLQLLISQNTNHTRAFRKRFNTTILRGKYYEYDGINNPNRAKKPPQILIEKYREIITQKTISEIELLKDMEEGLSDVETNLIFLDRGKVGCGNGCVVTELKADKGQWINAGDPLACVAN